MSERNGTTSRELELVEAQSVCRFSCRFNCGSLVSRVAKGEGETFGNVLNRRLSRRDVLKVGLVAGAATALGSTLRLGEGRTAEASPVAAPAGVPTAQGSALAFTAIQPDTSDQIRVAEGYQSQVC
jgi:secreted PhoX family phosphatase